MLLYDEKKSGSCVNELPKRIWLETFTTNFRCFSTSSAQNIKIFYQYLFNTFSELGFFIYQKCKILYRKTFLYPLYIKQVFFLWHQKITKCFFLKLSFITPFGTERKQCLLSFSFCQERKKSAHSIYST